MQALEHPDELAAGLLRHFGLSAFRPGQEEVIRSVLSGRNTVAVMPTGAGKSLCYQLPATLLDGVTLVVSPLIALMKDQVEHLEARGIAATFINSTLSDTERQSRIQQLRQGAYKLLYVAPERFRSQSFLQLLREVQVSLFAIDEAHCISQWGHDFRPDYSLLGQVRKQLRPPRTVALTATATPNVQEDIARVLLLKEPRVFVAGFDRPNLFLEVQAVSGDDDKRTALEQLCADEGSGIVYCSTRKATENMHLALKRKGRTAVVYHAGMTDEERHRAQDTFMSSTKAVAIATNAFGMGIDKPDLRFVAHANIPRAIEAYYQEIGRAGRDGKPSRAVLLFNHADVYTQQRLIAGNHPPNVVFSDAWRVLLAHGTWAEGVDALARKIGASEFEVSAALKLLERHGKLNRSGRGEGSHSLRLTPHARLARPQAKEARKLLAFLKETISEGNAVSMELSQLGRRAGLLEEQARHALVLLEKSGAVDVHRPFSGRTLEVLDARAFSELQLDLSSVREQEKQALALLRQMTQYAYASDCRRNYLLQYFGETPSRDNCGNCDVCRGSRPLSLAVPGKAPGRPPPEDTRHSLAEEELRRWRKALALELDIPPYLIFNDATLLGLAHALPRNRKEFLAVKGAGEARWERFGPRVLEICTLARAAGESPRENRKRRAL